MKTESVHFPTLSLNNINKSFSIIEKEAAKVLDKETEKNAFANLVVNKVEANQTVCDFLSNSFSMTVFDKCGVPELQEIGIYGYMFTAAVYVKDMPDNTLKLIADPKDEFKGMIVTMTFDQLK